MNLVWTEIAWEEYLYWLETDPKKLQRINSLIKEIMRTPFQGTGKPEPLKFELAGKWSRKIDTEHCLVYEVNGKKEGGGKSSRDSRTLVIYQCKYHY